MLPDVLALAPLERMERACFGQRVKPLSEAALALGHRG